MKPPLHPPADWFEHPGDIPTDRRMTITADGRVYGYIALRDACHAGMPGCVTPPMESPSDFGFAHQGETMTEGGTLVATANIGGGAGHADPKATVQQAADFYANTQTQLMRVRYGVDNLGLWFSGALWPDVDDLTLEHIRASSMSGDWRFLGQWRSTSIGHEFVGAALVNIPGYHMGNAGDVATKKGTAVSIAAAALMVNDAGDQSFAQDPSGNIMATYTENDGENNMSAQQSAPCPCNEAPKPACSCGNVVAEATPEAAAEPAPEAAVEAEAPAEQPKFENETTNDIVSSLKASVEDVGSRLTGIEDMLLQMYADKLVTDLEQ